MSLEANTESGKEKRGKKKKIETRSFTPNEKSNSRLNSKYLLWNDQQLDSYLIAIPKRVTRYLEQYYFSAKCFLHCTRFPVPAFQPIANNFQIVFTVSYLVQWLHLVEVFARLGSGEAFPLR